jgi:predicted exporter
MALRQYINLPMTALTALLTGLMLWHGLARLTIDADIVSTLPLNDPVIADARHVLRHHPMQDQVAVDLSAAAEHPEALLQAASLVERRMRASGLFASVGLEEIAPLMPRLLEHVGANLPLLFGAADLESQVAPLLAPEEVGRRLEAQLARLQGLEGIGQGERVARDPLGLAGLVMARLAPLAPSERARFHSGHLFSPDGRHLLILARPVRSGTDPRFAGGAAALLDALAVDLASGRETEGRPVRLTAAGAFRAALDNEAIARSDTRRAVIYSSIGIALLLLFAFPRPAVGLLAFLPALFSTAAGLWAYSFVHRTISPLTIGFGGSIISIAIDHGIAYLLFMDRPGAASRGREAAREIGAVGLLAMLTTVGAFMALSLSGFEILAQVGLFTALGGVCAFLFVHYLFPLICPAMPPGPTGRSLPLQRLLDAAALAALRPKAWATAILALALAVFARPEFHVDLRAMNSVRPATRAAEETLSGVWGNFMTKVYLLGEARDVDTLQEQADRLAHRLEGEIAAGRLATVFVGSALFPGRERAAENLAAWRRFWSPERQGALQAVMRLQGDRLGFSAQAFAPFWRSLEARDLQPLPPPEALRPLAGILPRQEGGGWLQLITVTPGPGYRPEGFFDAYQAEGLRVFDPSFFAVRLGAYLAETFIRMFILLGAGTAVLLLLFLLDGTLALTALLPILFALVASLGTLHLLGRTLDIPALMLSVVVTGIGVDYSLFIVCSHRRYLDPRHPEFALVRMAVFQAAASTLFGFGALALAEHHLLRSAGLTAFLGIGYTLLATYTLLPALLERIYAPRPWPAPALSPAAQVRQRFRHLPAGARLEALWRVRFDPLARWIAAKLPAESTRCILALPCGCGDLAAALLARLPEARLVGIEPQADCRRIAARVVGERGAVYPHWPAEPLAVDAAVLAGGWERRDPAALEEALRRCGGCLPRGGCCILAWPRRRRRFGREALLAPEWICRALERSGFTWEMDGVGRYALVTAVKTDGASSRFDKAECKTSSTA